MNCFSQLSWVVVMLRAHAHDMRVSGNMAATCQLRVLPWQVALVYSFHISYWTPVKIWYLLTSIMWSHHMFSFFFSSWPLPKHWFSFELQAQARFCCLNPAAILPELQFKFTLSVNTVFQMPHIFKISSDLPWRGCGYFPEPHIFMVCMSHTTLLFPRDCTSKMTKTI